MVWGMMLPSSFGKFWPSGKLEILRGNGAKSGWPDRVRLQFNEQTPEVQKKWFDYGDSRPGHAAGNYPFYVSEKLRSERGTRQIPPSKPSPPFGPILPHEWPQTFDVTRRYKAGELASWIKLSNRLLAVDEKLKDIIEGIEPDLHEFHPLELRYHDERLPFDFHTLFINQYFDSFSPDDSAPEAFRENGRLGYLPYANMSVEKGAIAGLAFKKSVFGGAHLWKERQLGRMEPICFSDELRSAIVDAGLGVPRHYQMTEV